MGLCPKPHLRTFEKVLKNPKTFKKGGKGHPLCILKFGGSTDSIRCPNLGSPRRFDLLGRASEDQTATPSTDGFGAI